MNSAAVEIEKKTRGGRNFPPSFQTDRFLSIQNNIDVRVRNGSVDFFFDLFLSASFSTVRGPLDFNVLKKSAVRWHSDSAAAKIINAIVCVVTEMFRYRLSTWPDRTRRPAKLFWSPTGPRADRALVAGEIAIIVSDGLAYRTPPANRRRTDTVTRNTDQTNSPLINNRPVKRISVGRVPFPTICRTERWK